MLLKTKTPQVKRDSFVFFGKEQDKIFLNRKMVESCVVLFGVKMEWLDLFSQIRKMESFVR